MDRKKQKFDLSDSILPEGDFEAIKDEDLNPRYNQSFKMLSTRKNHFLLTLDDAMIGTDDDSEADEDTDKLFQIQEMIRRSHSKTGSLF